MKVQPFKPIARIVLLAIGFMLLLVHHIFTLSLETQATFFLLSVLLTGIPHGAFDQLVHTQNEALAGKKISFAQFLGFYHKYLIFYGLLWFWQPLWAIVIFVFLSAYHFGETDCIWLRNDKSKGFSFLAFGYGIVLLANLFLYHLQDLAPVFPYLNLNKDQFLICSNWAFAFREFFLLGSTIILFTGVSFYLKENKLPYSLLKFWMLQWSFILLILLKMPMLLGFGFYFSLWHSILTLVSLREYLLHASPFHWKNQVKNGITNSVLAFTLIGFLIWLTGAYKNQTTLITILFAGIAVLTAPHMLVISDMLKNLKQKAA